MATGIIRSTVGLALLLALLLAGMPSAQSQDGSGSCEDLVLQAIQIVGSSCAGMGRNEACYGHDLVAATFQKGVDGSFAASGDLAGLPDLQALVTQPADPDAGTWGVAMMKVQADLPEAEDAMTFVLFGDTELTSGEGTPVSATCTLTNSGGSNINVRGGPGTGYGIVDVLPTSGEATADGRNEAGDWVHVEREGNLGWLYAPLAALDCEMDTLAIVEADAASTPRAMPVYMLRSSTGSLCEEAPNGLLVQSPDGQRAHVMINGVELEFASTGFLTGVWGDALTVYGFDGTISVTAFDQTVIVVTGTQSRVPLDAQGNASGPPEPPTAYDKETVPPVPTVLLPEAVPASPAIATEDLLAEAGTLTGGQWRISTQVMVSSHCGNRAPSPPREVIGCRNTLCQVTVSPDGMSFQGDLDYYSSDDLTFTRIAPGVYRAVRTNVEETLYRGYLDRIEITITVLAPDHIATEVIEQRTDDMYGTCTTTARYEQRLVVDAVEGGIEQWDFTEIAAKCEPGFSDDGIMGGQESAVGTVIFDQEAGTATITLNDRTYELTYRTDVDPELWFFEPTEDVPYIMALGQVELIQFAFAVRRQDGNCEWVYHLFPALE